MLPFDPESQARIFYLVLLGAFLLVYLFSAYRHRLGQALQHAAIWVLIFVGAVIAIGFWEPLTGQLYVDRAVPVGKDTLAFRRAQDGHFYATAAVNGQPVRFMVDTGASDLVLTEADARAAGIDTDRLNYVLPTFTANGQTMSAPVRLELGGARPADRPRRAGQRQRGRARPVVARHALSRALPQRPFRGQHALSQPVGGAGQARPERVPRDWDRLLAGRLLTPVDACASP